MILWAIYLRLLPELTECPVDTGCRRRISYYKYYIFTKPLILLMKELPTRLPVCTTAPF